MLQSFRTHKRWMMFIAMVFIVPSFVVTGIYSYNRMVNDENDLAEIGGETITLQEFDQAKHKHLDSLRRQLGPQFDPNMLDTKQARVQITEGLLAERALQIEMVRDYVMVSENDAINLIKSAPNFQRDGKFSREAYQQFLNAVGKSDEYFVMELRRDMARNLLTGSVAASALIPDTVARNVYTMMNEERVIQTTVIDPKPFEKTVKLTDEEIKAYYDANLAQFAVPESVDIEYVVLSPESFKDSVKANEEDIQSFYEQNLQRFTTPEERRASHILLTKNADETDEAFAARATNLYEEVKAKPATFAAKAKSLSKDPGSAIAGGDLGFFGKGMMVPEFEKAVFEGKKGDITAPVKTQFGYHIIHVTDVNAQRVKPLAEVRAEIEELYKSQAAMQAFAGEAENFSNMVYEQSDSLDPVAERFGLTKHVAKNVTRTTQNETLTRAVVEALYGFDCLQDKRNSNAIEIGHNTMLSARVTAHRAEATRAFDEVKGEIRTALIEQKALEAARAEGQKQLAALQKGAKIAVKFDKEVSVSRRVTNGVAYDIITQAMRPDGKTLPAYTGLATADGYTLIHVLNASNPQPSQEELTAQKRELQQVFARADQSAYIDALQTKFEATVLKDDYK